MGMCVEVSFDEMRQRAELACGEVEKIYLHWTAGHYNQLFDDYHVSITGDGRLFMPEDRDFTALLWHTWQRNSGAVGISLCCCVNAETGSDGIHTDFGPEPPTAIQIDTMAKVVAALCVDLGIPLNEKNVMTHCEAAEEDDYGPSTTCERWDLWYLPDTPGDGSMKPGGEVIRGKAAWYLNQWGVKGD